jgi:hypothetical protein
MHLFNDVSSLQNLPFMSNGKVKNAMELPGRIKSESVHVGGEGKLASLEVTATL